MLGFPELMPDCWIEVSLHPEGPATSQLDQGFPWFSLVPEQMLRWYLNGWSWYIDITIIILDIIHRSVLYLKYDVSENQFCLRNVVF
jgi:hypothetical protein